MAPRRGPLLRFMWRVHRFVWRATGGRLGSRAVGLPVLELRTVGRSTGRTRSVLLNFVEHERGPAVVASNAGHRRHPDWYHNVRSNPIGEVRLGRRTWPVRAAEATGAEREALWERFVAANPDYLEYAQRAADREIPIVVLESVST